MIWKWGVKFLTKTAFPGSKLRSLGAARHISNAASFLLPQGTVLTRKLVLTTLRFCPSGLVALSYFMWCARQPNYFHDKPTFHHMVSVVSELTRKCGSVKGIILRLETSGCVTKAQTFLLLMRIYWCGDMHDMVFETFDEMIKYGYAPNTYARNIMMDVLFKVKLVDTALKFLEEAPAPKFLSFNIAICNLCKLNNFIDMKQVVRLMMRKGYYMNPETYIMIMDRFRKFSRLKEALQVLGMMITLGIPVSVNVWGILIDCLCRFGQVEYAAFLLGRMGEVGVPPNIVVCTSVIKSFLECGDVRKAFEIVGMLESKGCLPDLVLHNVLIDRLSKMGFYENALEVFFDLRKQGLMPDVYTYSSIISTVCLSREYVLLPWLSSGFPIQPDLVVCNSLLSYFCKAGIPRGTVEFCNDMMQRGFIPDKYSYAAVLSAICRLGNIQEAVAIYHGVIFTNANVDAVVHTIMIKGLLKSGHFNAAMKLYKQAVANNFCLDVVSCNLIVEGLMRSGQMKQAYGLSCQMRKMDMALNQTAYNLMLTEFCKNRDFKMTKVVIQEMLDRYVELESHVYKTIQRIFPECLPPSDYLRHSRFIPSSQYSLSSDAEDTPGLIASVG